MGLIKKYFNNTRKPDGILGKMMVSGMNKAHAGVSDWGMKHLSSIHPQTIIELGCGGGRNAAQLLRSFPKATLAALDYSEVSVEKQNRSIGGKSSIRGARCCREMSLPCLFQKTALIWPLRSKQSILAGAYRKFPGSLAGVKTERLVFDCQ